MSRMIFAVPMIAAAMAYVAEKQDDGVSGTPAPTVYSYTQTNTYYSDRDCTTLMDWTKSSDSVCQNSKQNGCKEVKVMTDKTLAECKRSAVWNGACLFSSSETTNGVKVKTYVKSEDQCERKTVSGKASGAAAFSLFGAIMAIFVSIY